MFKTKIFKLFFIIIFLISSFFIFGLFKLFFLFVIITIFYFLGRIIDLFLKKNIGFNFSKYIDFLLVIFYRISVFSLIVYFGVLYFIGYNVYYNPPKIPIYIITNGDKTVVFQTMSHIASQGFYNRVLNFLEESRKKGYILFYEGVLPGKDENMVKFNNLLGFNFSKDTYKNLSKIYGLSSQNNAIYLENKTIFDKNVDISIDEIIKYYEENIGKNIVLNNSNQVDIVSNLDLFLNKLSKIQLFIVQNVYKSIYAYFLKNQGLQDKLANDFSSNKIFSVILDYRNNIIVNEILETEHKKIFVMYGMLHFEGVFKKLQENDTKWKIKSIGYFNPLN